MLLYDSWYKMPDAGDEKVDKKYHEAHKNRLAFQKTLELVNGFVNCSSILDVGCGSLGFLSYVKSSYVVKRAIDIYRPKFMGFDSSEIEFIHDDFLSWNGPMFDVVVGMEVLEHIRPDVRRLFAQKLLNTFKGHLIITIPYNWSNSPEPIPHSGYNESNVMEWFWPVRPDYELVLSSHYLGHFVK